MTKKPPRRSDLLSWTFQSYGSIVRVDSNSRDFLAQAEQVTRHSLLSNVKTVSNRRKPDQIFEIMTSKSGSYRFLHNGEYLSSGRANKGLFKFFDTVVRVSVGESARRFTFIHAGVVGWRGQAILLPGDSYTGKSTLVAELVKGGAEYYSDDFAILDSNGLVHPFPRVISMRTSDGTYSTYELTVDELGGAVGRTPIPVRMVFLTEYQARRRWNPTVLTPGQGMLEVIPFTLSLRLRPQFSLKVLNLVTNSAIIATSPRGSAKSFAKTLLGFFDKTAA